MSTKIYTGYRLPLLSLPALIARCVRTSAKLRKTRNTIIKQMLGIGTHAMKRKRLWEIQTALWEIERTQTRDPEIDISASACFFAVPNRILAIVYAEHEKIEKAIIENMGMKYYGYWNNADRDDTCTTTEWKQREKDWNKVFKTVAIPSQCGLSFTFLNYSAPEFEELHGKGSRRNA